MKRKAVITAIILAIAMLFAQFAFAGSLSIEKIIPADGEGNKQPTNMAVKIVFNEDMSSEANDTVNSGLVKITDPDGKAQEFELVHHNRYKNELWFVISGDLESDKEYTVTVNAGVTSTSGSKLAETKTYTFKTRNTKKDSTISLVFTFGMMIIMVLATAISTRKQQSKKDAKASQNTVEKVAQANPYRLAKEQGISVDEAKKLIEKEQSKADKKNAASEKARKKYQEEQAAREAEIERRLKEIHDASVYRVSTKGSLKAHGHKLPKALAKKLASKKKSK